MLGILNGQRVAVKMLKDSEAANKFLAEASLMTYVLTLFCKFMSSEYNLKLNFQVFETRKLG